MTEFETEMKLETRSSELLRVLNIGSWSRKGSRKIDGVGVVRTSERISVHPIPQILPWNQDRRSCKFIHCNAGSEASEYGTTLKVCLLYNSHYVRSENFSIGSTNNSLINIHLYYHNLSVWYIWGENLSWSLKGVTGLATESRTISILCWLFRSCHYASDNTSNSGPVFVGNRTVVNKPWNCEIFINFVVVILTSGEQDRWKLRWMWLMLLR